MDDAKYIELKALIENGFAQMAAEQRRQGEAIAELRGELRTLSAWMASMDQRFIALMHPFEPPAHGKKRAIARGLFGDLS